MWCLIGCGSLIDYELHTGPPHGMEGVLVSVTCFRTSEATHCLLHKISQRPAASNAKSQTRVVVCMIARTQVPKANTSLHIQVQARTNSWPEKLAFFTLFLTLKESSCLILASIALRSC